MDIESEHLGIPETEYKCTVRLPAAEFQRIIRGEKKRRKIKNKYCEEGGEEKEKENVIMEYEKCI